MQRDLTSVPVDKTLLIKAFMALRLQTEGGNQLFREKANEYCREMDINAGQLLRGLSVSSIKAMRRNLQNVPAQIAQPLAVLIFKLTGTDVTESQSLAFFYQLGFDIRLDIVVETRNSEEGVPIEHELKDLDFELQEANATAEDPENSDFELDLRIGFDRARLTIRSEALKIRGNRVCAETPAVPGEPESKDFSGWFEMRLASRDPLSWVFYPKVEGDIIRNRISAKHLARISTECAGFIFAELTAQRDALKVRVVGQDGPKANKSLSEMHREKMCAAVARRSMMASADEYVLLRKPLLQGLK